MTGLPTCLSTYLPACTLPVQSLCMTGVFHRTRQTYYMCVMNVCQCVTDSNIQQILYFPSSYWSWWNITFCLQSCLLQSHTMKICPCWTAICLRLDKYCMWVRHCLAKISAACVTPSEGNLSLGINTIFSAGSKVPSHKQETSASCPTLI